CDNATALRPSRFLPLPPPGQTPSPTVRCPAAGARDGAEGAVILARVDANGRARPGGRLGVEPAPIAGRCRQYEISQAKDDNKSSCRSYGVEDQIFDR